MSFRPVSVTSDAATMDQLSNRISAVLEVGARLGQQVQLCGMETGAGGPTPREGRDERTRRREERKILRTREQELARREQELVRNGNGVPAARGRGRGGGRPATLPLRSVDRRHPSPPNRGRRVSMLEDPNYKSDPNNAATIARALQQDGLQGAALERFLENHAHIIRQVQEEASGFVPKCGTPEADGQVKNANEDEDLRRLEIMTATMALAQKREGRTWNSVAIGFDIEHACAYELAGFLVSDT